MSACFLLVQHPRKKSGRETKNRKNTAYPQSLMFMLLCLLFGLGSQVTVPVDMFFFKLKIQISVFLKEREKKRTFIEYLNTYYMPGSIPDTLHVILFIPQNNSMNQLLLSPYYK